MKISVIPEQVAETLDAENHFIVREVFDVHLSDQGFELSTRSVSPYRKDYISDDDSDEDSACYGAFIDQELVGKIELNSTWNDLYRTHCCVAHAPRQRSRAQSHRICEKVGTKQTAPWHTIRDTNEQCTCLQFVRKMWLYSRRH